MTSPSTVQQKASVTQINTVTKNHSGKHGHKDEELLKKLYVLDTNVLIHDPSCLMNFENNDIFISFDVLEELDGKKLGKDDVAMSARTAIRNLRSILNNKSREVAKLFGMSGYPISDAAHHQLGNLYIQSTEIGKSNQIYKTLTKEKADNRILAAFADLCARNSNGSKRYSDVIIVSKDFMVNAKAKGLNLNSEDYETDIVINDADLLFTGISELPREWWDAVDLPNNIRETKRFPIPKGMEIYPNQLINDGVSRARSLIVKSVSKKEETFSASWVLDFQKKERPEVFGLAASNLGQNFALNLLLNPDISIVTILGAAGTGKTLLVLASALAQCKDKVLEHYQKAPLTKGYDNILMTRATIPVGEDIGFLPGTEEEKMNPWMGAVDDNIEVISELLEQIETHKGAMPSSLERKMGGDLTMDKKQTRTRYLRSVVKAKAISMMRGRTFNGRFVIVDEAQNLTPKQVKTLVSRVGPGSKIVLMGNLAQIDTPYLSENSSGLTHLAERFKGQHCYGHVILKRIERSKVAELAEKLLCV